MTQVEYKIKSTTVHDVEITELETVLPGNGDLLVNFRHITIEEFNRDWLSLVVRTVVEAVTEDQGRSVEGMYYYLGHWTEPGPNAHPIWGAQVVVSEGDVYNYYHDVTYTGVRVTVSAAETDWNYELVTA